MKPTTLQDKWGKEALSMGWAAIPSSLFFLQSQLQISPTGMNILVNLVMHWWGEEERPHPSQASLAARIGVSERTIQREIADLVEKGILRKKASPTHHPKFRGRNLYDLTPLVIQLNELAPIVRGNLKKTKERANAEASRSSDAEQS